MSAEAAPATGMLAARCPRCGRGFDCGAATGWCECFSLRLSPALQTELAARWAGCLCLACLRELAAPDPTTDESQAAPRGA